MQGYYTDKLSAEKLKECYEIAQPRIKQYLDAELKAVLGKINRQSTVLELGCGYGRVLPELAMKATKVVGIDTSSSSIEMGKNLLAKYSNITLLCMNAIDLKFEDDYFDVVLAIQNSISAFHVNQNVLIRESLRVTKRGGIALFTSYSDKFWEHRLRWFELQSQAGLLGEIDYDKTKNGVIVCKDGFNATTVSTEQFIKLTSNIKNIRITIEEVDDSFIMCEIFKDC